MVLWYPDSFFFHLGVPWVDFQMVVARHNVQLQFPLGWGLKDALINFNLVWSRRKKKLCISITVIFLAALLYHVLNLWGFFYLF